MDRLKDRGTLARYATVVLIVFVVGGLFVQREVLSDDATVATADGDVVLGITRPGKAKVGELAPDFVLKAPSGELVSLSDFRGKTVVLNFWATWCPPCRAEMPDLQEAFDERAADDDFVVLAVDLGEQSGEVQGFIDEFELTFPIALDSDESVAGNYGVLGLPASYFIDTQGIVRSVNLGPVFGNLLPDGIALADAHSE
jgi:peroxiredoxin